MTSQKISKVVLLSVVVLYVIGVILMNLSILRFKGQASFVRDTLKQVQSFNEEFYVRNGAYPKSTGMCENVSSLLEVMRDAQSSAVASVELLDTQYEESLSINKISRFFFQHVPVVQVHYSTSPDGMKYVLQIAADDSGFTSNWIQSHVLSGNMYGCNCLSPHYCIGP